MAGDLKEGKQVPDFSLPDSDGRIRKLSDFKGKKIVLYFYPRDDTPGCTVQACSFRDNIELIRGMNAVIIGVSNDDEKTHTKFTEKYGLNFILLSDSKKEVVKRYHVYGPKKFMGREFEGIHRTTFIIDENGVLLKKLENVNPKTSTEDVLRILRSTG